MTEPEPPLRLVLTGVIAYTTPDGIFTVAVDGTPTLRIKLLPGQTFTYIDTYHAPAAKENPK